MGKRFLSTIAIWLLVICLLYYIGPEAGIWIIAIWALATQYELYHLLEKIGLKPFRRLGILIGGIISFAPYYTHKYSQTEQQIDLELGILAVAVVLVCLRVLKEREGSARLNALSSTLFGIMYVPFMLHFLVRIFELSSNPSQGLLLTVWVIAIAKFSDVGALLTGLAIGKHPLSPTVSPNKTWEGAIGGVAFSILVGVLFAWFFKDKFPEEITLSLAALIAFPIAIVAIISDLIESIIKRSADVKDSGRAIPGIGGAFDLSDSIILSAPVGYLILSFVI
jgi:phosphatidate cytidylyltransferase